MSRISEIGFEIHDLAYGTSEHIDKYLKIYEELLPQYSRYTPVMRQRAEKRSDNASIEQWHQWLLTIHNQPVGMIEFIYNRKRNMGILLDFAVQPEARNIQYLEHKSLASLILNLARRRLIEDAQINGHIAPLCMVTEVEYIPLVRKYEEYGFVEFSIEYFEPPFTPELAGVSSEAKKFDKIGYKKMYLGAFQIQNNPINPSDPNIIKTALLTLWEDHYCLPVDHWLMQKILKGIHD